MLRMPDGLSLKIPKELQDAAARDLPDPGEAAAFEHGLRWALDGIAPPVASSTVH
jgi:hypothetical protein